MLGRLVDDAVDARVRNDRSLSFGLTVTADGRVREASATEVDVETCAALGRPHTRVRRHVEEDGVDVVVMGTYGHNGLERYLLGSVTEKLVRTFPVSVLTVRRSKKETSATDSVWVSRLLSRWSERTRIRVGGA